MDQFDRAQMLEGKHTVMAVAAACSPKRFGPSLTYCEGCGEPIPEVRRQAIIGVRLCVVCQTGKDNER